MSEFTCLLKLEKYLIFLSYAVMMFEMINYTLLTSSIQKFKLDVAWIWCPFEIKHSSIRISDKTPARSRIHYSLNKRMVVATHQNISIALGIVGGINHFSCNLRILLFDLLLFLMNFYHLPFVRVMGLLWRKIYLFTRARKLCVIPV